MAARPRDFCAAGHDDGAPGPATPVVAGARAQGHDWDGQGETRSLLETRAVDFGVGGLSFVSFPNQFPK